jgi:hypothetical protein
MALGLTQPLTETSTKNNSWGVKAAGAYGWQPYHLHVPIVLKSGRLNLLEPYGPVQACNRIALHNSDWKQWLFPYVAFMCTLRYKLFYTLSWISTPRSECSTHTVDFIIHYQKLKWCYIKFKSYTVMPPYLLIQLSTVYHGPPQNMEN